MDKIKFFKFDAIEPPILREKRNQDWVSYGEKNDFPNILYNLYLTSGMHSTAINAKIDAIKGEGLLNIGDQIINSEGETLDELYAKITVDMALYGAYSLNVIWSRGGDKIAEIYHVPTRNIRSGKLNENDKIDEYFYSNKWENTRKYKPLRYSAFNIKDNKGENASQIFYPLFYSGGNEVYNSPSYIGSINDIDLDARISRFHNAQIQNGLAPSLWVSMNDGNLEEDEKQKLYDEINDNYSSENNAGKLILTFAEDASKAPTLTPLQVTNDGLYTTLEERVQSRILTAHRLTSPLLVGIRATGSGLGSNSDEIEVAYTHFMSTAIEPIQKQINKSLLKILNKFDSSINNIEIIPSKMDWNKNNDQIL